MFIPLLLFERAWNIFTGLTEILLFILFFVLCTCFVIAVNGTSFLAIMYNVAHHLCYLLQLGKEVENNKLGKIFYTQQFNPSFVFCLVVSQASIHHHNLVLNPDFMCAFCLQKFLYLFIPFGVLILHRNFSIQELNYKGSVETFVTSPLDFGIDYFTFHILI